MSRLLAIAADLSAPPSEPLCWRDVTLYAHVFRHYEVVATVSDTTLRDSYNVWFKRHGLWDFVEDLLLDAEVAREVAVEIDGGPAGRLTTFNLSAVLAAIPR